MEMSLAVQLSWSRQPFSLSEFRTGLALLQIDNNGISTITTCGHGGTSNNGNVLATGLNPTLYTVETLETYGVFCSTCQDDILATTGWVYFRIYQRDTNGKLITSSDHSLNFTSNIAPLYQTSYVFIDQINQNTASTGQVSKIDLVQVQNYGSPICLSVSLFIHSFVFSFLSSLSRVSFFTSSLIA